LSQYGLGKFAHAGLDFASVSSLIEATRFRRFRSRRTASAIGGSLPLPPFPGNLGLVTGDRAAVIEALAERVGTRPLTEEEIEGILALAAVAAHGSGDRTTAPLASFLAGIAAAAGTEDRVTLLDELRRHVAESTGA
jgi:hypothetical protein